MTSLPTCRSCGNMRHMPLAYVQAFTRLSGGVEPPCPPLRARKTFCGPPEFLRISRGFRV